MRVSLGDLIAVTGANGAVGRRVAADLADSGYRIRSLSRSKPTDERFEFVEVDLASQEAIAPEALAQCAAVVHLAAYIPPRQEDPAAAELCFQTNALGTLKLLEAMERGGVRRLLQTTSANAYAPGLECPDESDAMFPDQRAPFYLSSKLVQDVFGAYWARNRDFSVTTLRLSSVYGADIAGSLFSRFVATLHAGDSLRLSNGGSFGADFVDVADVSAAVRLFLETSAGGAYNIASGQRRTLLEAARILLELSGVGADRLLVEAEGRPEAGFPAMDISKARQLGFNPRDLGKGLAELVRSLSRR